MTSPRDRARKFLSKWWLGRNAEYQMVLEELTAAFQRAEEEAKRCAEKEKQSRDS